MENKISESDLTNKHYNRIKNFLTYDIEGRDDNEKIIILQQVIKVAKDILVQK